jgi:hypothetical protein
MQTFSQRKPKAKRAKKATRKRKRTGYNQRPSGMYHFVPAIGPTRANPIPSEFSVALCNTDYDYFATGTSYSIRRFGMVEFLSYRPLYCLELYQIYKYARITAVDFELRVNNTSTTIPLMAAIGFASYADVAGITPDRFWERPTTIRKNISVQGGLDRVVLRKTFVPQDCYGQPYLDQKFWVDVSQSASTTPLDANEPVVLYCLSGLDGGNMGTCYVDWRIRYHIQFFDLRTPSSSLEKMDIEFETLSQAGMNVPPIQNIRPPPRTPSGNRLN